MGVEVSSRWSLPVCIALATVLISTAVWGQASYTAQIRGVVTDQSSAVVPRATITITNDATGISVTAHSDDHGQYILTGLRPAVYTIKAEGAGFRQAEQRNVVLQVSQQTTIDFTLHPLGVITTVEVSTAAPLLDTESASLGTDVSNEYVRDIPLYGRSMFGLVFLAGGVTETTGSGINDNYPTGTNVVSNGQRNATAQVTLDGSGWWYGQRSTFDARDYFNTGAKPDHVRDQYGFALGGPLKRNKTFFFTDFEKVRQQDPINLEGIVPTDAERNGDFSQDPANSAGIYDPCAGNQGSSTPCPHNPFPGNIIPANKIDPIGQAILNLYPHANIQ